MWRWSLCGFKYDEAYGYTLCVCREVFLMAAIRFLRIGEGTLAVELPWSRAGVAFKDTDQGLAAVIANFLRDFRNGGVFIH